MSLLFMHQLKLYRGYGKENHNASKIILLPTQCYYTFYIFYVVGIKR